MSTNTQNRQAYQILCAMRRPTPFAVFAPAGKDIRIMRTDEKGYPFVLRKHGADLVGVYTGASKIVDVLADLESVQA
ncbi:hypothetical protein [Collimonas humicola]|uniref:hypothetical protein n=1 Tax=Collimonas humicola TaxID=2825886 RepID=UPI001B8BFD5C|nr:hypothetical protein [Collimonas humicola]